MRFSFFSHRVIRTHFSQVWRFLICGGTGFVLDLSTLTLFVEKAHIDPRMAVILSSCVGAIFVFIANKLFTFKNREPAGRQFLRFVLVYGLSIVLNAILSNVFLFFMPYLLAKSAAIGLGTIWNYFFSHSFIFRQVAEKEEIVLT